MPGLYAAGEYDLAGFIVGAVEQNKMLDGAKIEAGDCLIGLPSTGLHTNGYSLARKLMFEVAGYAPDTFLPDLGCTVADELLKVHRSYARAIRAVRGLLLGAAHITGGGITDNTPRMLPKHLAAEINLLSWTIPPVFEHLRALGNIPEDDARRTFNLGVGMILAVPGRKEKKAMSLLEKAGEPAFRIGTVVPVGRKVKSRVVYLSTPSK